MRMMRRSLVSTEKDLRWRRWEESQGRRNKRVRIEMKDWKDQMYVAWAKDQAYRLGMYWMRSSSSVLVHIRIG